MKVIQLNLFTEAAKASQVADQVEPASDKIEMLRAKLDYIPVPSVLDEFDEMIKRLDLPKFYLNGVYDWCSSCPNVEVCDRDSCTWKMTGGIFRSRE